MFRQENVRSFGSRARILIATAIVAFSMVSSAFSAQFRPEGVTEQSQEAERGAELIGQCQPGAECPADPVVAVAPGPDVTFCQLYGLQQFGRLGSVVGLAVATTSRNVGGADLAWFASPDSRHPFIIMNLFRLKDDQFEQIGQSWIKHGFFALSNTQCGGSCTFEPGHSGGNWLGMNCTDTYTSSLNASQGGLGPRYEVNPWTGSWTHAGSHFSQGSHSHNAIDHRLQVHDNDLNPAMNAGATYFTESYYVHYEDVNVWNSAAWKSVTVSGSPGGTWSFGMSGSGTLPNFGFVFDAWAGATLTEVAIELPVREFLSPDGRSVLAAKPKDLGGGTYRYEYALYNIDMDRKVGTFSVPIPIDLTPSNIGFHAVQSHGEPYSNDPWSSVVTTDCPVGDRCITWTTVNNPIRWGTMYNFRFDIDALPDDEAKAVVGLFEPGTPGFLTATTVGPELGDSPPPPAVGAEPDGMQKSRFISFALPENSASTISGLRVEVEAATPPGPPSGTPFRYVNAFPESGRCCDSNTTPRICHRVIGQPATVCATDGDCEGLGSFSTCELHMCEDAESWYKCARLGCQPEYRSWGGELSGLVLHVTGNAVAPSSSFNVSQIGSGCGTAPGADNCESGSEPLTIGTSPWGDSVGGPDGGPNGVIEVLDVSAQIDKIIGIPSALAERRLWTKDAYPDPVMQSINILDLAYTVNGIKGMTYQNAIDACQ